MRTSPWLTQTGTGFGCATTRFTPAPRYSLDIALRVAQWVTMMHDGRMVVEGSRALIRDNKLVHDLNIGSRNKQ